MVRALTYRGGVPVRTDGALASYLCVDPLVEQAYQRYGLSAFEFMGTKYLRIKRIKQLQNEGLLDGSLRWRKEVPAVAVA